MKKIIFSLLVFIGMLAVAGCSANRSKRLGDFSEMRTWFSEQEVEDLQNMTERFEREIGIAGDASDEERASGLAAFNKRVLAFMEDSHEVDKRSLFPLTKEQLMALFDILHVGTFRANWNLGISYWRDFDKQGITNSIHSEGNFISFLAGIGKEYPPMAEFHDDLIQAGDFSPTFVAVLLLTLTEEEMKDPRVRLVYTVFYATWGMRIHEKPFGMPE